MTRSILLVHPFAYLAAHGGGTRLNRTIMERFAERGHRCRVLTRDHHFKLSPAPGTTIISQSETELLAERRGVIVHKVLGGDLDEIDRRFAERLEAVVDECEPDVVLVADEVQLRTPAPVYLRWLEITLDVVRATPIIAIAHTVSCTPFGPSSFFSSEDETQRCRDLLNRASAVITPSRFAADYLQRHGGVPAVALRWPIADRGPYPDLSGLSKGMVGLINPSAMKGVDILIGLATEMPSVRFHARISWATSPADCRRLESLPNVVLAPYAHHLDEIYEPLSVVLAPSVCHETLALVPIEAMVHGIPAISADLGGLPEAMLGRPQLCPVAPIERWDYDAAAGSFSPVVPAQDLEPWKCAIQSFLQSEDHYRELSAKGRAAALDYIQSGPFHQFESRVFELAGLM